MFGGAFGIWQWLIVLAIVLLLFGGRGKISSLMGDFGKGLRNFKTGVKGEEDASDDVPDEAGCTPHDGSIHAPHQDEPSLLQVDQADAEDTRQDDAAVWICQICNFLGLAQEQ